MIFGAFGDDLWLLFVAIGLWYLLAIFISSASIDAAYRGDARRAASFSAIVIVGHGIPTLVVFGGYWSGWTVIGLIPCAYAFWCMAVLLTQLLRPKDHWKRDVGHTEPTDAMDSRAASGVMDNPRAASH